MNTLSWRSPTTPLPVENNPSVVFERLFGEGGTREERLERMRKKRSCSTASTRISRGFSRRLALATACGSPDTSIGTRGRAAHPDGRRAERGSDAAGAGPSGRHSRRVRRSREAAARPAVAGISGRPDARLHADVRPRIEQPPYPEIGISEPHHGLSHHGDKPEQIEKYARLNTYHAQLFALLPREAAIDARRRQQSARPHHPSLWRRMSNPNVHLHVNLPLVVAGGGAGRSRAAVTSHLSRRQRAHDEPPGEPARQGWRRSRQARRQHRTAQLDTLAGI